MRSHTICMTAMALPLFLTGCAGNITGLVGAHEDFGCPASGGVNCTTVTATYEREHASEARTGVPQTLTGVKETPSEKAVSEPLEDKRIRIESKPLTEENIQRAGSVQFKGLTSRKPERLVMLWVLPWVDAAGDLHSDSRVWMRVHDASWRIESVRTRAMQSAPEAAP